MTSRASRSPSRSAYRTVLGCLAVVAVLSAGGSRAQTAEATAAPGAASPSPAMPDFAAESGLDPFYAERFPNVVLKTHEGRNVRFYDDLLKGKIVLINFMYATCTER